MITGSLNWLELSSKFINIGFEHNLRTTTLITLLVPSIDVIDLVQYLSPHALWLVKVLPELVGSPLLHLVIDLVM